MIEKTQDIKLHDIKDLVQIPDNSIFIFALLVFVVLITVFLLVLLIIKLIKNRKRNLRKEYFKTLENLDFKESKQAAYLITKYVRILAKSEREKKIAYELIEDLHEYKYKKEVKNISEKTKAKLSTFMDIVDV